MALFQNSMKEPLEANYKILEVLGQGATAVVRKCQHKKTQAFYALKNIKKKDVDKKIMNREVSVLLRVSHPNIIKMREIYETEDDIFLVLELVTGGEMFDRIVDQGCYSEQTAQCAMKQILEAADYLHDNGILHRDLKVSCVCLSG
jgi:calcium/calmodulin-dependent protein kinase-4